jgi:hypothetical protein
MSALNYSFEIAHVTLVAEDNRYCGSIDVPVTNQFPYVSFAESVLLTAFKPGNKRVFTSYREFTLLEKGKFENEYDRIAVCQQYFNELLNETFTKHTIVNLVYTIDHIWITSYSHLHYIDELSPCRLQNSPYTRRQKES